MTRQTIYVKKKKKKIGLQFDSVLFYWGNYIIIAPDKTFFFFFFQPKSFDIFFYFSMKTCCGYSIEVPCQGASNEYPQHIFSITDKKYLREKKQTFSCFSMKT